MIIIEYIIHTIVIAIVCQLIENSIDECESGRNS